MAKKETKRQHMTGIERLGTFPERKARAVCMDCSWKGRERIWDVPAPNPEKVRVAHNKIVEDAEKHRETAGLV